MKTLLCTITTALAVCTLAFPNANAASSAKPPAYPHYRLIDLGTLGGPNGGQISNGVTVNERGDVIALGGTTTPDPFPDTPLQDDGLIWHAILGNANGVVLDLGGLGGNHSLPFWISGNG